MKKLITVLLVTFCLVTFFITCVNAENVPETENNGQDVLSSQVIYDLPTDGAVMIPENDCFEAGVTLKVEQINSGSAFDDVAVAMEEIATSYVAYEFIATKDGAAAQLNEKLTVTFKVPSDFGTNVVIYFVASDAMAELLNATVDDVARTVTVSLENLGTYVLADADTKPHYHEYSPKKTAPTCISEGYTTYTCSCGDKYVADTVPKSDHPFKSVVSLPTCVAEGYTAYTCTACGYSCTDNVVGKTDHVMGEWKQSKAPTYTEQGEERRECKSCDLYETRPLAMLEAPATTTSEVTTTVPVTTVPSATTVQDTTTVPLTQNIPVTSILDEGSDEEGLGGRDVVIVVLIAAIVAVIVAIIVLLTKGKKKKS